VPGLRGLGAESSGQASTAMLPLESSAVAFNERGWEIRLPVRAEEIAVEKQVVVRERVVVGRREVDDVEHVDASVRREQLRVDVEGEAKTREA